MVTGGLVTTIAGFRVSARSPVLSLLLAASVFVAWFVLAGRRGVLASDLGAIERSCELHWRWLLGVIAFSALVAATAFQSSNATGADASGYLSYSRLLLNGELTRPEPLASLAKWADGPATLAPLGWREGLEPGRQVPTYAIGLPLLMAPMLAIGGEEGATLLIAATFAIAVFTTGMIAHRMGGAPAAVIAATWLATSPIALMHAIQVMSDVPVTAAWLIGWWAALRKKAMATGIAVAVAVLIRPNLAPLAAIPVLYIFFATLRPWRDTLKAAAASLAPVAAVVVAVGYLQWRYFGSPLRSGYGTAAEIYDRANILPNTALYAQWLVDSHGPWLFIAPVALLLRTRAVRWLLAFAALNVFAYLIYAVFESWTYLRFMLPAISSAMIAVAVLAAALLRHTTMALRLAGAAAIVLALIAANITAAREYGVFRFADRQARARIVAERLAATLPVNTVLVTGEHSGTLRYYTGRTVLRWDLISAEAMPQALEFLRLNGYRLWVVLDDWEEEPFRKRFPELASISIDHQPTVESPAGTGIRTRAWPLRASTSDQASYGACSACDAGATPRLARTVIARSSKSE